MSKIQTLDFGDFCMIEQKRHGVPNEKFIHKVIGRLQSNTWVDVPVQSPATETIHDVGNILVDVVACICCGVQETEVRKYRVKDVKKVIFPAKQNEKSLDDIISDSRDQPTPAT